MDVDSTTKSKSTCADTAQLSTPAAFNISIPFLYSLFVAFQLHLKNRQRKIRTVIHYQLRTSSHSRKVCPWYSADDVPAKWLSSQSSSLGSKISVEGAVLPTDPISNQPHATLLRPVSPYTGCSAT